MKLHCNLDEVLRQHGMSVEQLAAQTGIDRRTISKLDKDVEWRLSRRQIEKLIVLSLDAGLECFFRIRYHPIWATFEEADAHIYRGPPRWDAEIEHQVSLYLQRMGGSPRTIAVPQSIDEISRAMTETNCLFVGSPRSNPATEIALCLLSNAKPFDDRRANRDKVLVQILGIDPPPGMTSAVLVPGREHGFRVSAAKKEHRTIAAQWLPKEHYDRWYGEGPDAAIVVICRSPLNTTKEVTTILVMGYTGLATQSASHQLTHGAPIDEQDPYRPGEVRVLSYEFQFKKPQRASSRSKADPRREITSTGVWSRLL